jgi:hypothetical protein
MPGYDFTLPPRGRWSRLAIAKIFTISSSRITALHSAALTHLKSIHGPTAFISPTDTTCALIWVHITRARVHAHRIDRDTTTSLATAINIRNKLLLPPPAAPNAIATTTGPRDCCYLGNMWLRAFASSTVKNLVQLEMQKQDTAVAQIADAAWAIRGAVRAIQDDPVVLRRHVAIAARATMRTGDAGDAAGGGGDDGEGLKWLEVDAAVRRAVARHSTGVDVSVGVGLGADVAFEIPGVAEGGVKAAWVRSAYVAREGFVNVLPRRGGAKGEADWEVCLGLREEDMQVLEGEGELGGWLCKPPA